MQNLAWTKIPNTKKAHANVPTTTGVYIYYANKTPIYIGKSVSLKARLNSHLQNSKLDPKEAAIIKEADHIRYAITDNEFKALLLESQLIQKHQPRYNRIWKDDKSYLYIRITEEEFPKIYPVRKTDIQKDSKHTHVGPFPSGRVVDDVLKSIRRVVPFCMRKSLGKRVCFYSKLGLCNPCPSHINQRKDPNKRSALKRKYRANIRKVLKILSGNTDTIAKSYQREIKQLSKAENYELALKLRNKLTRFTHYLTLHAFSDQRDFSFNQSKLKLDTLLNLLEPYFPQLTSLHRIECYDASTFQFKDSTASMVVLTDGLIDKSQYRRFKIKRPNTRSDFAMLEETLIRRLKNKWPYPDLIVIDGGKPQLRKILRVLDESNLDIPLIGIAKNPDRLVITPSYETIKLSTHNPGFNLIQLIRNESHRFANSYQKTLRNKKLKISL